MSGTAVSPMDLLKNPMILIAIVGLGFVFGMPYLLDNSTYFLPYLRHLAGYFFTTWGR